MSESAATKQTETMTADEALTSLRHPRAEFAEATKDLTDEEREALIDRWADDVRSGLAERVRKSREKSDHIRC
ncbi:MAG: hypothetical protein ACRDJW_08765 [Thermomicrobiales bacterium]